ncbi:hypothetical protein ACMD2_10395 [Ananas comosus]|uniref:Uncharacterized protein n=1 Tax=Ananas comosus TaxID=4615 RepID=A0A199UU28_ANACO|nr:hypothetical protein ACMD2_10395 [Ananas comosus]
MFRGAKISHTRKLLICALKAHTGGVMERRLRRSASAARLYMDYNKPYLQVSRKQQRAFPTSYFRVESVPLSDPNETSKKVY